MIMDEEMNLTPQEKEAFSKLEKYKIPRAGLEESIINILKQKQMIMETRSKTNYAAIIAASVLMFIAGYFTNRWTSPTPDLNSIPSDYMLLLKEDANFHPTKNQDELVSEYKNWLLDLREKGVAITGAELDRTATPSINGQQYVSGFFMVKASSKNEADQIARACPHLKYGGLVDVMKVVKH